MSAHKRSVRACPRCRSTMFVAPIVYGLPLPEDEGRSERGEVVLGGCIVYDDRTRRYCRSCRRAIQWKRR